MGISIREGLDIAERNAWATKGKRHSGWFTWGKRVTPLVLIAAVLGAAGYGLHELVQLAGRVEISPTTSTGTPAALWFIVAVLMLGTVLGLRFASKAVRFAPAAVTYAAIAIAWCGAIGYGLGTL